MTEERGVALECGEREPEDNSEETLDVPACPKCGEPTSFGFGLAFGGIGPYVLCMKEGCGWYRKRQSTE